MGIKESIFFSGITILIVFQVGYYFIYPETAYFLSLEIITSIIVVGIVTALVAGLNVVSSGENTFGTRIAFIASTLLCILFRLDIPVRSEGGSNWVMFSGLLSLLSMTVETPTIPIGIGLLYSVGDPNHPSLASILLVDGMGMLGMLTMVIVTIIVFFTVISGVMIMAGDSD